MRERAGTDRSRERLPSPPEVEILLLAGRPGERAGERLRRLVADGPDWTLLVLHAAEHELVPLLYDRLRGLGGEQPPLSVMERLRGHLHLVARRNLHLTAELVALLRSLEGAGVPAVPLKGPVLASSVYANPALREFSDLDILVRPGDHLRRAAELLASRGFVPIWSLSPGQEFVCRHTWYAYGYHRPEDGVDVELHWRLAPAFFPVRGAMERAWRNTERITLQGEEITTLRPEWLLLSLCIHGAKTEPVAWPKLKWILDVAELLRGRPDLDWALAREEARRTGCLRVLHLGLRLARDLFRAPLPERVEAAVDADEAAARLARHSREAILVTGRAPPTGRLRYEMALRERAVDRVGVALSRAVLPGIKDILSVSLPRPLTPLYVPLRLLRLAGRLLAPPWRAERRSPGSPARHPG